MKKRNIIILVLLLVVGFATVSTSLILNGNTLIGVKEDDFDVIFTEALMDGNESSKAIISEDKKSITFNTKRLRELNEEARLEYKVKNNSTQYGADVTISCNNYGNEYIKVSGEFDGESIPLENPIEMEAQEIKNGYISAKVVKVYSEEDTSFDIKCSIVASATTKDKINEYQPIPYKEDTLNGTDPVVANGLIPVVLANDGTVTYADIESKWYSYEEKKWANAVILENNVSYKVGETIKEEDIESYFVWIPRYKYQIFDEGNYTSAIDGKPTESIAKEIQIEFESKDVTPSTGSTKDSWLTHPAFTNFDVNGLWIGKFETGYKGATTTESAQVNAIDSDKVIVKPNVYSWRGSTVSNIFKTAYNYKRGLDSHMMKNTEWGAVAYLSHSKYGINTEVRINNNSNYLTGYAAADGTDQSSYPGDYGTDASVTLPYNTPTGYKASTTGKITGIYDMSGGTWEYVAGYTPSPHDSSNFNQIEFSTYSKYLDLYPNNSTSISWNNRILGDATGEMGPFYYFVDSDGGGRYHNNWYGDHLYFVDITYYPWFSRGSSYGGGIISSQFASNRYSGEAARYSGFRIVLAP